ncbi:Gamma-tubulin complex component 6 [Hondaea fermentalgiana]|uniref:Gamma-tubulin complex component 6 n=1 Tax=Hondaea fermentalgiana TaxID=2315210 RepID=A0A2R5GJ66_9STRA|nr:Gamma-tubulin complex component 6 [Hondaea fermentalgiana]|eukprot:GBG27904.1 Gamma-tubulin complex component 6 [Hondaea fermentalgiana]
MEADVRRSVRALGATQGAGNARCAEETFFGGLWAARHAAKAANLDDDDDDEGQRRDLEEDGNHASESEWREKRNARRANEILRAFEFNFRREGHARAAETLDACLEYLGTSYTGDALPSVLTLLSMLARSYSEDPVSHSSRRERSPSQVILSDTADRLLAASSAIAHGHASLAPQASQMSMNSEAPGMDPSLIRTVSLTPSAQRLLGTSTDGPATTLRLRVQTRTPASELKRYPLLPLDETSWAEAAENGSQVFRRLQGENDITEEEQWNPSMNLERLTMDPTSRPARESDPQNVDENFGNAPGNMCADFLEPLPSKDCLLGALVSQTRSNLSEVNITLSLPELDTEYDGFAPDPLGLKIAQDRHLASLKQQRNKGKRTVPGAAERKLRYPQDASEILDERASSSDSLLCEVRWPPEEDLWLRLAHTAHPLPPRLLLGWEEEVAASFETSVPHDECLKALQYSSHAVLSSERGPMWLEHLIQHSGRFERSRGAAVITAQELQRDLVYALLGVPSRSFELHTDPLRLEPCETRLLAGTVEGLGAVLDQVAACGSTYLALANLCKGDPILPEAEVAEVVVERIDAHLLAHQRRVGLLFQSASQSEHDAISLLEISHRIEMSLAPPLRRLRALFAVPRASVTTIQMLEHFHASALASGASLRSMERGMLWCCLERVVDVLAGWSFGGADAFEHFDGCFFRHAITGDEASSKDGSSPSHEALLAAVTEKRLLYALHLPSFCKSSLRGVSSPSLARRATRCGALLRLLRGMPNCAELYELCTRKTDQDAFRLDALRAGNGANAIFLQKVLHESSERKQHLIAKVAEHCNESEKKRFFEQEARRKEAWKVIEDSRIAAEAVNARFIARSEEEQRRIEAERKAQLEEFRAAAEDAKSAKVRARLEKQRQEREEQPRDLTSPISDEQRTEAEHYLLEQFERLAQEQAEQGGVLDAKLAAAKHELETKLASLQTASQDSFQRSDATTSVVVQQPPGGHSVAASLLYGNENATGRSRSAVHIVGRAEDGIDARAAISNEPLARDHGVKTSVHIVNHAEEGADARAAISNEPLPADVDARSSIVKRDKEEGADARAAISDEPLASSPNARTSVRIVKRDKEEGVDARAAISDEPLAAGVNPRPTVHIVGSVSPQASKIAKPSVRVQQSPGGETSFAFGVHPDATRPAVQVNQPAGGHSSIEALMTRTNRSKSEESERDAMESLARRQKTVRRIRDAMVSAKPLRYGDAILSDIEECRQPPGGAAKQAILDSLEDLGCDDAPCGALDAAIELAVVEPLLQQCDLVEATFVAVVVRQSNVLEALDGVRSTILMAQGDLYNGIVDRLYEMRLRDGDLRHRKGRVLQEVFASEADGLALTERPFASRFHYAVDVTCEAAHSGHSEFSKFAFVDAQYELHWPLSFIVREQDKAAYPQIHRFLLQLKYAGALVRRVWTRLCATKALGRLPVLTWLSTRWHQVRNLISNLEDYLMTTLLTEHWAAMQAAFGAPCASFRHPHELQEIHHRFVEAAMRTCFLDGSNVSKVLHECVSRAMERTDALARHSLHLLDELLDGAETNVQRREDIKVPRELEQAWREFSKTQTFLLRTVQSYSRSALSSDGAAQRILVHLNFNCFFSSA